MLTCYCEVSYINKRYHAQLHLYGFKDIKVSFLHFESIDRFMRLLVKSNLSIVINRSDSILKDILANKFVIKYSYVNGLGLSDTVT